MSAEAAWRAAHVDEDFQIGRWGEDDEAKRRRAARWRDFEAAAKVLAATVDPPAATAALPPISRHQLARPIRLAHLAARQEAAHDTA